MDHTPNQTPAPSAPKKKRRSLRRALLALLLVFVLMTAALGVAAHLWRSGSWQPSDEVKQFVLRLAKLNPTLRSAYALKDDLQNFSAALMSGDPEAPEQVHRQLQKDLGRLKRQLSSPLLSLSARLAGLGGPYRSARELVQLLDDADRTLIAPLLEQVKRSPLSDLSSEDGIRVDLLRDYLDFAETLLPEGRSLALRLGNIDLSFFDRDGTLAALVDPLAELFSSEEEARAMLEAGRAVLGGGEDRLYLFAAQNSSEIRASGGFPGSVGLIRIENGLLTISDFRSVYKLLQQATPASAEISYVEELLFSGRMHLSWDSDFSPDFERVAEIWALAYEARNGGKVDGVISGTPAIIQRLLSFLGSVTLSDGTELNGENATRVLGHDLYFRYLGADQQAGAAELVDGLFADAARETMQLFFSNLNAKTALGFLSFFRQSTADRTLMLWMADEEEQALIRRAGWNAGLNDDPSRPQAGIFFNSTEASKMAWFLNIEAELSEPALNEDGSKTYELTVRFVNTITPEERAAAGWYILGGTGGITGSLYLFAPAGGRMEEAVTENGYVMRQESYEGLELAFMTEVTVYADYPIVIRCRVTTAPEAEEPLALVVTPTMQDYR